MRCFLSRRPAAGLLAVVIGAALVVTACDDGDSDPSSASGLPDRTTTTVASGSSSTAATTPTSTVAPGTLASPDSCGIQAEVIAEAAEGSDDPSLAPSRDRYTVANCRLSQSEQIWAVVDLVPAAGAAFTPTTALMERIGATWFVRQLGSLETCDAPERVRVELGLACSE